MAEKVSVIVIAQFYREICMIHYVFALSDPINYKFSLGFGFF